MRQKIGLGILSFGTLCLVLVISYQAFYWYAHTKGTLTNAALVVSSLPKNTTGELPLRVIIPHIGIDVAVIEAPLVNGYWQTSDTQASHGIGSANPGEKTGNIVIFAHERVGLFLSLSQIKQGDKIYIQTKKSWHVYKVMKTSVVNPTDISIIQPTAQETLTLYTCSGFFDENRFVVRAMAL
ncbi:MAG TPA: sortase [Candidatus Saccharimonadales bacterium]|nr:sortase [Candidatus Saccharimonadales bacterium]